MFIEEHPGCTFFLRVIFLGGGGGIKKLTEVRILEVGFEALIKLFDCVHIRCGGHGGLWFRPYVWTRPHWPPAFQTLLPGCIYV
jgi:hypothetical protein